MSVNMATIMFTPTDAQDIKGKSNEGQVVRRNNKDSDQLSPIAQRNAKLEELLEQMNDEIIMKGVMRYMGLKVGEVKTKEEIIDRLKARTQDQIDQIFGKTKAIIRANSRRVISSVKRSESEALKTCNLLKKSAASTSEAAKKAEILTKAANFTLNEGSA